MLSWTTTGRQLDGAVADVMSHGKGIGAKFDAFGWNVIDVADGNDVEQILGALEQAKACKGKPTCLDSEHGKGQGSNLCRAVRRTFFAADQGAVG